LKKDIGEGYAKKKAEATTDKRDGTRWESQTAHDESQHCAGNKPDYRAAYRRENPKDSPRF
jgi:hypothetical protein